MGPEQAKLLDRLFGDPTRTIRNFNFTVGDGNPTPEQLCGEINRALDEVARRQSLGIPADGPPRSKRQPLDVRDLVAELSADEQSALEKMVDGITPENRHPETRT